MFSPMFYGLEVTLVHVYNVSRSWSSDDDDDDDDDTNCGKKVTFLGEGKIIDVVNCTKLTIHMERNHSTVHLDD